MYNPGSEPSSTPPNNQPGQPTAPVGGYTPPPQQPQQYGAPPPQQPSAYPPVPQPPPKKRSPLLFILLGVLLAVVLCVVGVFVLIGGVFAATQPVVDAGDAYMTALRDGNYSRAFDLSSASLQQEAVDASGLENALSFKQPSTWSFNSRSINGDTGNLSGTTTYKDGSTGTVEMSLVKESNAWKVVGIRLN